MITILKVIIRNHCAMTTAISITFPSEVPIFEIHHSQFSNLAETSRFTNVESMHKRTNSINLYVNRISRPHVLTTHLFSLLFTRELTKSPTPSIQRYKPCIESQLQWEPAPPNANSSSLSGPTFGHAELIRFTTRRFLVGMPSD